MARRQSKHLRPARPLSAGHATSVIKSDGRWIVRSVPGSAATKAYRCPGCNAEILPPRPHRGVAKHAWPALPLPGRRAPSLAHGLLATALVNASAPEHGLFSTQLGTTGPRVVFLHGLFGQGKNWNTIGKALSESARVMLVDLPNHGQSAWTDHFSYPEMAGRVAGLLKAQGEGEQYAVVGHSMGGKVAMTLAFTSQSSLTDFVSSMSHQ